MSSKRRRTTSNSAPEVKKATRLTSRLSEFDTRVTLFEPGPSLVGPISEPTDPDALAEEGDEEAKHNPKEHPRKRVKLEDHEAILIGDLETFAYNDGPATRSMRRGAKTEKTVTQLRVKEDDEDESELPHIANLDSTTTTSRANSPTKLHTPTKSKVKQVPQALAVPHPVPPNWKETYDTIKAMRSRFVAPVDTMGCDQAQTGESEPRVKSSSLYFLEFNPEKKTILSVVTESTLCNARLAYALFSNERRSDKHSNRESSRCVWRKRFP